jgi:hypothetical protein
VPYIILKNKNQLPEVIQRFRNEGLHGNLHVMKRKDGSYLVNVKKLEKPTIKTKKRSVFGTIKKAIKGWR